MPRRVCTRRALDATALSSYTLGTSGFIASSLMHLCGAPRPGDVLRIPSSALLLAGATAQMLADTHLPDVAGTWASSPAAPPPPPPHALDWPSVFVNMAASALYLGGSVIAVAVSPKALAGSLLWLVGSLLSLQQTLMLVMMELHHASNLRHRAEALVEGSTQRSDSTGSAGSALSTAARPAARAGRLQRLLSRVRT